MAIIDAAQTTAFVSEYSENLFSNDSNFDNEPAVNITSGSMVPTYSDEITFDAGKSIHLQPTSYNSTDVIFNFGTALQYTIKNTGSHIFSIRLLNPNTTVMFFVPFVLRVKLWKNAVNTDEFVINSVSDLDIYSKKWVTWAQSFDANFGDVIDFSFQIDADLSYPFPNINFWMDALKLELDNRFLGTPSIYSKPLESLNNIPNTFVLVDDISNLPTAVAGVITLEDNYTYYITSTVDLAGNRLVGGSNTPILGASSENSILTSTGLGVGIPLLTSIYTTPIRHICIKDVDTAIDFDGSTNPNDMALDFTGINFVNVPNVGTVKDASNFIFDKGAFLNSKGLSFDGTIGTVGFGNCLFSGDGLAGNLLELLSTCVITRRFRVIYSSIVAFGSTTGINVNVSATVPTESYILDTINFSGGGSYLGGVMVNDNKTNFLNCKGIQNSAEISQYFMHANATTTVVASTGVAYKVLGTTTSSVITQKFTNTNNRATYVGSITRNFLITATLSFESGNNNQIGCYIAKNGSVSSDSEVYGTASGTGRAENITIQTLVELSENDYIEIFVENESSITNILVTDLNVIIK